MNRTHWLALMSEIGMLLQLKDSLGGPTHHKGAEIYCRLCRFSMEELPHRRAARIVVVDAQGRVLLFRHAGSHGRSFWATPGGGLEDGETFEQAARREASEELGVTSMSLRLLWEATNDFVYVDHPVRQQERYFLMESAGQGLLTGVQSTHQQEGILEARWWSRAELEATTEPVFPEELATQLGRISLR